MTPLSILLGGTPKIQVNFELASEIPSSSAEIRGYENLRKGDVAQACGFFLVATKTNPERSIRIADACMNAWHGRLVEWILERGFIESIARDGKRIKETDKLEILSGLVFFQATGKLVQSTTTLSVTDILAISQYKKHSKYSPHAPDLVRHSIACDLVYEALEKDPQRALISVACLANVLPLIPYPNPYEVIRQAIIPGLVKTEKNSSLCDSIKQQARDIIDHLGFIGFDDKYTDRMSHSPKKSISSKSSSISMASSLQLVKRR